MKKSILALTASILLFAACKKDDEPSKRDHLTSGKWKMNQFSTTVSPFPAQDGFAVLEDCQKDNLLAFLGDMTLQSDEGTTKCNDTDPQTQSAGIWNLNTGDTKLYMSYALTGNIGANFTIDELTASNLRLHFDTTLTQAGFPLSATVSLGFSKN